MAAWQLNESRGAGGSDKVWKLSKEGDGLTIGRAAYCDIQVLVSAPGGVNWHKGTAHWWHDPAFQSQSVEKKQSTIKWDEKRESFIIHDLGSSNVVRYSMLY